MSADENLLVIGDTETGADGYRLCGFLAPDPVICARVGGRTYLAVSALEYGRARRQARVDELLSFEELDVLKLSRELGDGSRGLAAAAARLLRERGADSVAVPPAFGVAYADELRARGVEVRPDGGLFSRLRRTKTEEEISHIERAQRAVERSCERAVEILREARTGPGGGLFWNGETLTSEILRSEIEISLLRHGCSAKGTIVAGGAQAADPHETGSGPLRAGETIILDIFPLDRESRYHADMTRTFVKGEPQSAEIGRAYRAVLEAQEAALGMIRAGANGRDVHRRVSDILHEAGYETTVHDQKEGKPLTRGFFHGTGHGLGLEVHESPRISLADEELREGDVVTVEPGVYDPDFGGVRIEDLVVVTAEGCRNLTRFPKEEFRIP